LRLVFLDVEDVGATKRDTARRSATNVTKDEGCFSFAMTMKGAECGVEGNYIKWNE